MSLSAWEIKNKFCFTLREYSEITIQLEWDIYRKTNPSDEHAFVLHFLKLRHIEQSEHLSRLL